MQATTEGSVGKPLPRSRTANSEAEVKGKAVKTAVKIVASVLKFILNGIRKDAFVCSYALLGTIMG